MSLTELLQAIEREAAQELEAARAQARAEARELRERARAEAAALEERLARADAGAVRREADALRAAARHDAAQALRSAHEDAWQDVAEALRGELAAQPDRPGWAEVLTALVEEALAALPAATEAEVLPRDIALVEQVVPGLRVLATDRGWGGVVLSTDDRRRLDNTLEARLAAAEPLLRRRLATLLPASGRELLTT